MTNSLSDISAKCHQLEESGNLVEAIKCAELASDYYGLEGLLLYLPIRYRQIQILYGDGEIIEQDSQQALTVVFLARKEAERQNRGKEVFDKLDTIEKGLLAITQDVDFIIHEAKEVARMMGKG
jgi:hypothetical protein